MRDNWGRESVKGRWCGAHWVESEVRGRFRSSPGGPPAYPALGQAGELEGPGDRLGTTSCRAPGTSPRPPTGWARAWGSAERLPYPCLWDLLAVAGCLGHSLWDLVSPSGLPEETEDHLGRMPGSQGWQLGRVWEPGPKELPTDLPPFSQDWDLGG